ncbi:hypothetical protein GOBAR_AA40275 [Gossypium barbadense]|uniref:non-specific serine/threonine protein kinase n=1 Tax=Gossypium barbadense TaxID=3634 RepID=A0A2P5VNM4_GOSBA|nr:hypothetical protein GOBAR_AA40275 [Gossypium barbadense]
MDKKFITMENRTAYVKLERIVLDQLDHPGIMRLYFTFQDNFSLYMALEPCEGGELFDQINRKGRLSEDEARFYAAEVVDALEYIHNMGLMHRDIKPENLLLIKDGHIKIADFGSVKPMQDSRITVLPNASSDDKACTFVGTATFVPPEVLNSSPATFGQESSRPVNFHPSPSTAYPQSPLAQAQRGYSLNSIFRSHPHFADNFQIKHPEIQSHILNMVVDVYQKLKSNLSELGLKEIEDMLLKDLDPSRRPGAGPDGYAALKTHPFFRRIEWSNLRTQTPPELVLETGGGSSEGDDRSDSSANPTPTGNGSARQNDGSITRLTSIESFDSRWQQFLEPGESVLLISMVKKVQKLTSKKVQLILTNKPKLIYVDPAKLVVKANIIWSDNSDDLSIQVSSPSHFKLCTVRLLASPNRLDINPLNSI